MANQSRFAQSVDATSLVPGQAANFAASLPATINSPSMSRPRYSWPHSPFTGLWVLSLPRDMRYFIPSRSQPICMIAGGSDGGRTGDRSEVPVGGERRSQSQGPGCAAPSARATHQRLRTIYFDTPNQDLWNQGFTLRVRAIGESHVQTVKRIASSRIERDEWEAQTDRPELDLGPIKNTPLARLTGKTSIRRAMRPAFEVNASIDQGAIEANGEKLGVNELELELKSGVARAFVSQAPLHPSLISKAERGHLLGRAAKSSKPRLAKKMTCRRAFQEICQTCLHDFHLNLPGGEVRQCRGNSPKTHRDETPSCGHDAL